MEPSCKSLVRKVAILYQALAPPVINGVRKAPKPGGYSDSGADIAFALSNVSFSSTDGRCGDEEAAGSGSVPSSSAPVKLTVEVVTPVANADPLKPMEWVLPDTPAGIEAAVSEHGADTLWANTVLFAGHPLEQYLSRCWIVGQTPAATQAADDKFATNAMLAAQGLPVALSLLASPTGSARQGIISYEEVVKRVCACAAGTVKGAASSADEGGAAVGAARLHLQQLQLPLIVKPVRGRGSQGVVKVETIEQLTRVLDGVKADSSEFGDTMMVEEYLEGEEITVTVLPRPPAGQAGSSSFSSSTSSMPVSTLLSSASAPTASATLSSASESTAAAAAAESLSTATPTSASSASTALLPWALPPVRRINHINGVAPYNGVVAVTRNSMALTVNEIAESENVRAVMRACEQAAVAVQARAPIRIDCRADAQGVYRLFDLNMKPNMTGAGRPGRDDQDSLSLIAARAIGWDYKDLLLNMVQNAWREQGVDKKAPV